MGGELNPLLGGEAVKSKGTCAQDKRCSCDLLYRHVPPHALGWLSGPFPWLQGRHMCCAWHLEEQANMPQGLQDSFIHPSMLQIHMKINSAPRYQECKGECDRMPIFKKISFTRATERPISGSEQNGTEATVLVCGHTCRLEKWTGFLEPRGLQRAFPAKTLWSRTTGYNSDQQK